MNKQIEAGPCVVNKFVNEEDATKAAQVWSKERRNEWTVTHSPSSDGPAFFVIEGDGGMISSNERLVGRWISGRKQGGSK